MTKSRKTLTFIDLFCGLGGFRIAFESLNCKCVFSSDIDSAARETYKINFGEYPSGDITEINACDIPNHDILCAGFPCQPFSIGGKRLGFEDTRGTLFFDVLRILKEKKPKAFFLENVSGIINHDNGRTISVIESSLRELNYCIEYRVINAKDVGYPQNRNRWYCVGIKNDILDDSFDLKDVFPKKESVLKYTLEDVLEKDVKNEYRITDTARTNIEAHKHKFIESDRYCSEHLLIANEIRKSRCNFRSDGICPCLTAKMGTGGNNIPVIVEQNRKLTEKECLKIMGFPSSYVIRKNYMQSYKQIGNSVVVPIIYEIAKNLIELLDEE